MNATPLNEDERTQCASLAALLRATAVLAHWGLLLCAVALLMLALTVLRGGPARSWLPGCALAATLALSAAERYLALRLKLDAGLFEQLARGCISNLATLDNALTRLRLRAQPAPAPLRPLDDRIAATRALAGRHLRIVLLQALAALACCLIFCSP